MAVARAPRQQQWLRVRLERREAAAVAPLWLRVAAIVISLAIATALLTAFSTAGSNVFSSLWLSTFGSPGGWTQILQLATPLILAGAAVAFARRAGLWNIGVNGQMFLGAWAGTLVAFTLDELPGGLLGLLMVLAGVLGGALWALVPALLRAYLKVNEIITTLMLNFVAFFFVVYWTTGPWRNVEGAQLGSLASKEVPAGTFLPEFSVESVVVGSGFAVAVMVTLTLWAILRYTRYGYHALLAGGEDSLAAYAGVNPRRTRLWALVFSGAIGGLAGIIVELDQVHRFSTSLTINTGYIGIVVAVLAASSLGGCIPMGLLMATVTAGGIGLRIAGITSDLVLFLTGLLLVFSALADVIARYRVVLARDDRSGGDAESALTGRRRAVVHAFLRGWR
jgi:simple sugar transport system permease protein